MFDVLITKETKRVGEIHTVSSVRKTKSGTWYIIWIDGMETALDPYDCKIVKDINIHDYV